MLPKKAKASWNSVKLWNEIKNELENQKYLIVYDLETTGLSAENDRIIEIAAIRFRLDNLKLVFEGHEILHKYINPGYEISEKITEITGITNEFLSDKETEDEVFPEIVDFFESDPVAGYNVQSFDNKFMHVLYARHGDSFRPKGCIDGIRMARERISKSDIENYKLVTVGNYFGIKFNAHSAIEDTLTTAKLIQTFLDEYSAQENKEEVEGGTYRPILQRVSYWEGFKGRNRIYVSTSAGSVYYDLFENRWGAKDAEINELDMEWLEARAWELAGVKSETEFRKYRGTVNLKAS
jgi:DNA polymerase III epsilon subunit-like protein